MRTETDSYTIECTAEGTVLRGVLRLHSPIAYQEVLQHVYEALEQAPDGYRIDIHGLKFLNSSGITALSRFVLRARDLQRPLLLVGNNSVAWQRKTLNSLGRLYDGARIEFKEE